jgi:hypothetical protein
MALPGTIEELSEYEVVILGDASPRLLTEPFRELLDEAVRRHGVGLIVAAGPSYMPHAYGALIHDLLPVEMHPGAAGMLSPSQKPFRLKVSPEGTVHEVMRLYEDIARNETAWAVMPPFYWCAAAERPGPAATVLAWNPNLEVRYGQVPLIAFHFAGKGKVLFLGLDSTWHWRQNVGERFFYKFWGQAIRFVGRGEGQDNLPGQKVAYSRLVAQPLRVEPGQPVEVILAAVDADGNPETADSVSVLVEGPESPETVVLLADPFRDGRFTGTVTAATEGPYRVSWSAKDGEDGCETQFQVVTAPEELRHPNIDRAGLHQIAATSGGEVLELGNLAAIPDKLQGETKQTRMYREATVWDNWLVLLVLILVYSLDVGLRRLKGLT